MKRKWMIVAALAILSAWGAYLVLKRQGTALRGEAAMSAQASASRDASGLLPARDRKSVRISVREAYESLPGTNLPFAEEAARFLRYAGMNASENAGPSAGSVLVIDALAAAPERVGEGGTPDAPQLSGEISLGIPGRPQAIVEFNSAADPPAGNPAIDAVFKSVFLPAMAELVARQFGSGILLEALGAADPDTRAAIEKALVTVSGDRPADARQMRDALLGLLRVEDPALRAIAAHVLGALRDPSAVPAIIAALSDSAPVVRVRSVEALGAIGDAQAVPPVLRSMGDETAAVRSQAVQVLGRFGDTQSVPALVIALKDPDEAVRDLAVEALETMPDPDLALPLLAALETSDPAVQKLVIASLGNTGDRRAVDALISALSSDQASIRSSAAEALGRIADARALDSLLGAMRDPDPDVRLTAVTALGRMPDRRAVPPLIQCLGQSDEFLRLGAAMALSGLTRQRFGPDAAAWARWWDSVKEQKTPILPFETAGGAAKPLYESSIPAAVLAGPVQWPALQLAGVMTGDGTRKGAAMINSRVVKEGERIEGVTLSLVRENSVELRYRNQVRLLWVNESTAP